MNRFPGWLSVILFLLAVLAAQLMAAALVAKILPRGLASLILVSITNLTVFLPAVFLGLRWAGLRPRWWGQGSPRLLLAVLLTVSGATVVLGQVSNLVQFLWPMPPLLQDFFFDLTSQPLVLLLLALGVVAPLTEELLFRGLVLPGLTRRYGFPIALISSSLLFGLFHLNPWQALPAALAGLYLGWLRHRTGGVGHSMLAHAVFNGLPFIAAALGWTVAGYNDAAATHAAFEGPLFFVGGLAASTVGLVLTTLWAPLSPPAVSDTLAP